MPENKPVFFGLRVYTELLQKTVENLKGLLTHFGQCGGRSVEKITCSVWMS